MTCKLFLATRLKVDPLSCSREVRDAMRQHARECESCRSVMDPNAPAKLTQDELVAVIGVIVNDAKGGA
jgi:hypothetical protein